MKQFGILDSSVIVMGHDFGVEVGGAEHHAGSAGWVMAGSCGGYFRNGQAIDMRASGENASSILSSVCDAMGKPTVFGRPEFAKGPLAKIKA